MERENNTPANNYTKVLLGLQENMEPWVKSIQDVSNVFEPAIRGMEFADELRESLNKRMEWIESLNFAIEVTRPVQRMLEQQANMINSLQLAAKTSELWNFQNQLIQNKTYAADEYMKNFSKMWKSSLLVSDIYERSIAAQDIAFLRLMPNYRELDLPWGSKKAVKGLTKSAAEKVTQTEDILIDPKDGKFFHKDNPYRKISADRISVAESSLDLFEEIKFSELVGFESELVDDPCFTFARDNAVGEKIYQIIKGWNSFIDFDKESYFHARSLGEDDQTYTDQEMLRAPAFMSKHGRYNPVGKACYYFAESSNGAVREVSKHMGGKKTRIQVVEIKPIKKIKMIDLSKKVTKNNEFMTHMRYSVDNDDSRLIKQKYLLPNYVASCCKHLGIDGIKYLSGDYKCYVTWEDNYFEFVNREIVE